MRTPKTNTERRPGARLRQLQTLRPTTPDELHRFMQACLGLRIPRVRGGGGEERGPFAYVCDAYFDVPGDAVVWANRGGGKTMLGAAATLLDLLFKPGIDIRILGGSRAQTGL